MPKRRLDDTRALPGQLPGQRAGLASLAVIAGMLAGCAVTTTDLITSSLQLPAHARPSDPLETYAAIARGVNTCWLGRDGPFRQTHILHADAKPLSDGGAGGDVDIAIHERVTGQASPLGFVAYRIRIRGSQSHSTVAVENLKMPIDVAQLMSGDVEAWSRGERPCSGQAIAALVTPKVQRPSSGVPLPQRGPGKARER